MNNMVVHCKKEEFDVYIGRPGKWGNPFAIGPNSTREDVVKAYEKYIRNHPTLLAEAKKELKGKVLGCWCAPHACHGDVLVKIANFE